ncbi:hypothetical protein [Mycolicibacterium fortuitum]|uniref:hypothetical protein n=1 Tax=Mycolicibacterium fortuitum TaxID=1766 RepID=UPI0007EBD11D|nr:hypothetical protein [Mycolicibacterium fortuitum]OBB01467.1 hypothetical protein A5668_23920 [Mycolicibacterium fortuitum]TPW91703.1 hypothetical protein FKW78_26495 [Mycolicibacterium fortuitum]UBV24102.1 hypothetical protein H8Z59_13830 [Mycolicibacterium fortuitum]
MTDRDIDSFIECRQVNDMSGVTLNDDGSFGFESISFVLVENATADDGTNMTSIHPASFVPLGLGVEVNHRLFDFLDRYAAKKKYENARWDIQNLTHTVEPDDENPSELIVETTFDLIVTVDELDTVFEGCGFDSEILPLQAQFSIADGRIRALDEYKKGIQR